MILTDILRALQRRWYIVLIGAMLAGGATYAAWVTIPPGYERLASVLLLPGQGTLPDGTTNPYLYLGGLTTATDVLVGASAREVALDDIMTAVPGVSIMIGRDVSTSAPAVSAQVVASSDADAARAMKLVLVHITDTLADLQAREAVPSSERISLQPLYIDAESTVQQKTRVIIVAAAGGGILAVTIVLALIIDALVRRTKTRRAWRRPVGDEEAVDTDAVAASIEPDPVRAESDTDEPDMVQPEEDATHPEPDESSSEPAEPEHEPRPEHATASPAAVVEGSSSVTRRPPKRRAPLKARR
ncbi:hypothetical protein [Microbacterium aurum]